ncbi:uncharacterized protein PG998_006944 [Apiospora kogelbergensis]|uniref:Uncharacterized protein n=1 Tax=Apiospora kogelbergensis TaxID=1337665 RepID=A0AAW0QEU0_9PEZI
MQTRKIDTSVSCPTGNFTFGEFVFLGVCSKRADISKHITKGNSEYPPRYHNEAAGFDSMFSNAILAADASSRVPATHFNCTMFRMGNINISNHNGIRDRNGWKICNLNGTSAYLATASSKSISQSLHYANTSATLRSSPRSPSVTP